MLLGLLLALLAVIIFSPFASKAPDTLEKVTRGKHFLGQGKAVVAAPLAGYVFPGIKNRKLAVILAGGIGTVVVFLLGHSLVFLLKRKNKR